MIKMVPFRKLPLATNEFYHIYNRGVAKLPIFIDKKGYERFLLTQKYYRFSAPPFKFSRLLQLPSKKQNDIWDEWEKSHDKQVEIISYVLMPNHFHFLLKQTVDDGISTFIRWLINSYAKYLNTKHDRVGPLLQGPFKAVRVESDEQLLHLSRYIHLNPLVSYIVKESNFLEYPWSSLRNYIEPEKNHSYVYKKPIQSLIPTAKEYLKFVIDHADYAKKLERINHLTLEP